MSGLDEKVERLILLENEIGLLLQKIDYANQIGSIEEFGRLLEKDALDKELIVELLREDIIHSFSFDELYVYYVGQIRKLKENDVRDKIFTVFDLIERKRLSIERGR